MKKYILGVSVFILAFIVIGIYTGNIHENGATELKPVEIKEYQGNKLSSIEDFRENSIKGPQHIDKKNYRLVIAGLVNNPKEYTYDEIIKRQNYKKVVTLHCVEGWSVNILWEGILVKDLIKEAGADPKAKIIIFHAYDGYSTSFPINYIMENDILMAHKMNGLPLPPERGFPFQLVAESKWGYKWIKWITKFELSDNENYRGYWERRGYSNDGSLNRFFLESY
ncbi:MAG: molybdopterin-dependent oxidoreductase [Nitrospirota bacterium]|nr:molybdopterin-dependent oxidoreductase [Nitrospirota bacterium]MDH5769065.1 molybdopterin-dependent oxidoreductase [Nitrospirota bacterium]